MAHTIALSTGQQMPLLGLGTWKSDPGQVKKAVREAIWSGYRLIDTAYAYNNEAEIGSALEEVFGEGILKREDIFVTTKLGSYFHQPADVEPCLKRSLQRLKLDYVDLYLIHIPGGIKKAEGREEKAQTLPDGKLMPEPVDLLDTWRAMEAVFKKGLAKAIGVSNFSAKQIRRICEQAEVRPHNLQVECHLYFPQDELLELCKQFNITFTAFAPLGSPGRLEYKGLISKDWPNPGDQLKDPLVNELAKKHEKTGAQILLRWLIQRNVAVIPKSVTPERIRENAAIFDFTLSDEDMQKMKAVPIRQRFFLQDYLAGHPDDPFADER